jgi:hypothetical protein
MKQSSFITAHKDFTLPVVSTVMVVGFVLATFQVQAYITSSN